MVTLCPLLCQFLMKIITVINLVCACIKTCAEDDDFQSLSKGEREDWREREFSNFELLISYVCTIQFLVVLYYEIERQLKIPAGMNKVLCYITHVLHGHGHSNTKTVCSVVGH